MDLSAETQFVLTTFMLLAWGALVMWMCAGFTLLEAGSVRTKNSSMICLKNVGIYALAGLAYYIIGYNLHYVDVAPDDVVGTFKFFHNPTDAEVALVDGVASSRAEVLDGGQASMAFWFFQMVFVATACSIVSGAIAERIKLWAFFTFTLVLAGFVYPIVGSWIWGGGWLADRGFQDFAGGTVVHITGGVAALTGLLIVGPRYGKFRLDGTTKSTPPSNVPLVTLGVLILWFGWFGFNGGSYLVLGSAADAVSLSAVLVNTNLSAAAGAVVATLLARRIFGSVDLAVCLNGALAGLVSVTAGPQFLDNRWALLIGAVGGLVCTLGTKLLEMLKIDDVVGAIPVHLFCGIWGSLAVSFTNDADIGVQLLGVGAVSAFVFVTTFVAWKGLDVLVRIRVTTEIEMVGQDVGELGIESHPEFMLMPDDYDE